MIQDLWYKNAVIYSLDLKTFMDANGDGIGDLEGLIQRLDYLHSLGIDAIWLAPLQPSPGRDNGYDISDYYGVDPQFGSSGDFVEFMHRAKERGIRVLLDLVVNHTSDQHRWFQEACKDPESKFYDWYVWSEKRPANAKQGIVFPGRQDTTWTKCKEAGAYYYHRFYEFQPDLNMDNPAVRAEIRKIIGYWLEMGVAGFRVDAVPFVIESIDPTSESEIEHFEYLLEFRKFMRWRVGNSILLGEANVLPKKNKEYFGHNDDGLNMMFNFYVNQHVFYALATADVEPLAEAIKATKSIPPTAQWAQFLRNHDELDLGRLTDEQQQQVFERFAPDPDMLIYDRGIRRRLAPMLGNRTHQELAYSLMFSLPGAPVIRYGDEIGMGDDLSLGERSSVRTPMQWSDEPNGGFSTAKKTVLPVIDSGVFSYKRVNVETQRRDPDSLLNWMTQMIRVRHECLEIGWGECHVLKTNAKTVLALRYDWQQNSVVVLHNFAEQNCEVKLKVGVPGGERLIDLLKATDCKADERGSHHIPLDGYGYRWFRVGDLNYAAHRIPT